MEKKQQTKPERKAVPEESAVTVHSKKDTWDNLTIQSRFVFAKVMQDPANSRPFLVRLFPEMPIGEIRYSEAEKNIEGSPSTHGVRLDVYIKDTNKHAFTLEMQVVDEKNLRKRSRYYTGMMDEDFLQRGQDYDLLPPSFVIFICPFDLFGKGLHVYTFKNYCEEVPGLPLQDGTTKIFLNTTSTADDISEALSHVLDFFDNRGSAVSEESPTADPYILQLQNAVTHAKANVNWRKEYMLWQHELAHEKRKAAEEGHKEGLEEGRKEGRKEGETLKLVKQVCQKLRKHKTPEQIADELEEDTDIIENICRAAACFAPEYPESEVFLAFKETSPSEPPAI